MTTEIRYRYNQSFESINALVPSDIALLLVLVPAILMALAVVREKELGSITNLYVTPVTRLEFILGKQLPYVGLAMVSFVMLTVMAMLIFGVPRERQSDRPDGGDSHLRPRHHRLWPVDLDVFELADRGSLRYGHSHRAAATQFAGMLSPLSSLTGLGAILGRLFPMSYYLPIAVGTVTKSLGFAELRRAMLLLSLFIPGLLGLSLLLLRKQER